MSSVLHGCEREAVGEEDRKMATTVIGWGVLAAPESVSFPVAVACRTERLQESVLLLKADVRSVLVGGGCRGDDITARRAHRALLFFTPSFSFLSFFFFPQ